MSNQCRKTRPAQNSAHLDPISSDEEELQIPINSVPVILPLPSPPATGPSNEPITTQAPLVPFAAKVIPIDEAHIATPAAPPTTPVLTTSEWSLLIAKAQSGDFPCTMQGQVHEPNAASPSAPLAACHPEVFTAGAVTFSLKPQPGALPDCLIQMALNHVFIPLSMLTTCLLNDIEMNQDVKYKCIQYGSGAGKIFLDKTSFPTEEDLSDFEFGKPTQTGSLLLRQSLAL